MHTEFWHVQGGMHSASAAQASSVTPQDWHRPALQTMLYPVTPAQSDFRVQEKAPEEGSDDPLAWGSSHVFAPFACSWHVKPVWQSLSAAHASV